LNTNAPSRRAVPAADEHAANAPSYSTISAKERSLVIQPLRLSFLRWQGVTESVLRYSDPDSDDEWDDDKSDGEQLGSDSDMDSEDDMEEMALREEEERMKRMGKLRKDGLEHADFLESDDAAPIVPTKSLHENMVPVIVGPVLNLDARVDAYFATKRAAACRSVANPLTPVVLTDDERELMQYRIRLLKRQFAHILRALRSLLHEPELRYVFVRDCVCVCSVYVRVQLHLYRFIRHRFSGALLQI
jgi:hypothetical protein